MKNKLKKGFTIVELVIVIAVIAILAAVLIPTFSSITNSARESAALQEAKSGSETVLALTTGTLPENSAFIVADDEESDTNDYTFVFAGQKIQNVNALSDFDSVLNKCKRNDVMKSGAATVGYIVYVSIDALKLDDKGQVTDTVAGGAGGAAEQATLDTHVANRILAALNIPAEGATYTYDLAQNGNYAMWTSKDIDFNIYWTSDFNPTLIAFMGGNVASGGTEEPEVETVNVTCDNAATVNSIAYSEGMNVNKNQEVKIVLTDAVEVGGTTINQPADWTYDAESGTITIPAAKVTGDISVSIA